MNRRSFLASLTAAPLFAQQNKPLNILLILTDDLGYADVGCYGAKDIRTPNIDRLAKQGVRLTDCYSNGPVCTPTRAGLMTGRYQQRFGLEWAIPPGIKGWGLETKNPTIATLLKRHNPAYKTGLFGKWHLGYEPEYGPNAHGFDEFYGLLSGNVDHYSHKEINDEADWYENLKPIEAQGYSTELIRDRAVDFIRRNAGNPFFCYVPFNSVHWPFQAPGRPNDIRKRPTWFEGTRKDYALMMESIDSAVGALLAELDKQGLTNNTLVIFTNDNGGERLSDNRPFFHHKATLWEGGIRVPAILRWPGHLPAGNVSRQAAMSMDLAAMVLSAAGAPLPANLDGIDLLNILRGREPEKPRDFCWRIDRADRKQKAVRHGDWKYVRDGNIEHLSDLRKDPGERVDLAYENPEALAQCRKVLADWEADLAKNPPPKVVK